MNMPRFLIPAPRSAHRVSVRAVAFVALAFAVPSGLPLSAQTPEGAPEVAPSTANGSVEGRVFNQRTGRYLNRAVVEIVGTSTRVFTNQFGEYELFGLRPGSFQVRVSYTGMSEDLRTAVVRGGEVTRLNFFLGGEVREGVDEEPDAFELADFEVSASGTFQDFAELAIHEERFSVNLKNVVAADAYGTIAQGNIGEFVKFIPGVEIDYGSVEYSSGADATQIRIRGFNADQTQITMDGMSIANAQPGTLSAAVGLDMLSINNASRVEVIKVPTPDQPSAGLGGTINLISKTAFEYPKPTVNFRVYFGMNSENLKIFQRTPGPMAERTYKTRPSFDFTYAYPINEKIGFTFTLARAEQVNENQTVKTSWDTNPRYAPALPVRIRADESERLGTQTYTRWVTEDPRFSDWQQTYGADWSQWSDENFREIYGASGATDAQLNGWLRRVKRVPRYENGVLVGAASVIDMEALEALPIYFDAEGNEVGRTFYDYAHPYLNNVSIADSPRLSTRDSASFKLDYRPLDGLLLTGNYQFSTFTAEDAGRRFDMNTGNVRAMESFGPTFQISRDGAGRAGMDLAALDRDGETHSTYLRASYIKGPWNVGGHVSYSYSEGRIVSVENGHFSGFDATIGGIDRAEFFDIDRRGLPGRVNFWRYTYDDAGNKTGEVAINPADLSEYNIAGVNVNDPQASTLRVLAGNTDSTSEVTTAKFDVRRQLDFIPGDFMQLSIKAGIDWDEREEVKTGRGINYVYQYLGTSGVPLRLSEFRDDYYVNVDPGFGFDPREWPDLGKMYDFFLANPDEFSDTYDVPRRNASGGIQNTAAAQNYIESANTNKRLIETRTSYYVQLEGDFFNNRLSVVGGLRFEESTREGSTRFNDSRWSFLRTTETIGRNGLALVARDIEVAPEDQHLLPTTWGGKLQAFSISEPFLPPTANGNFDILPAVAKERVLALWGLYEKAGLTYNNGTPFKVSDLFDDEGRYAPFVEDGTLRIAQLKTLSNFPVSEKRAGRPRPIISAAFDLTDNWVLRGSWARRFANEAYEGPRGTLRTDILFEPFDDGTGGRIRTENQSLRLGVTDQFDIGITRYTDAGGKFSLNGFFSVETNRRVDLTLNRGDNGWEEAMLGVGFAPGSIYFDPDQSWEVTTAVNSDGEFYRYGYEFEASQDLAFLGDWGKFVYAFVGFTHKFERSETIPGSDQEFFEAAAKPHMDAAGGFNVRYKRVNLRANWTWKNERERSRSQGIIWADPTLGNPAWYKPGGRVTGEDDPYLVQIYRMNPEEFKVDVSFSYRLTDHLTFDFSARNILNYNKAPFLKSDDERFANYAIYDEQKNFGVNFTVGLSASY